MVNACEELGGEREVEKAKAAPNIERSGVMVMRCNRAGRGNGARIADADAPPNVRFWGVKRTLLGHHGVSGFEPKRTLVNRLSTGGCSTQIASVERPDPILALT
jgi:hypothetical protein